MTLSEARPADQVSLDLEESKVTWPQIHYYKESNGRGSILDQKFDFWEALRKEEQLEKEREEEEYRKGLPERIAALERKAAERRKMREDAKLYYRKKELEMAGLPLHWASYSDGKIAALVKFGGFAICYMNVNGKAERVQ
jgi:hypothetical protein